KFYQNYRNGDTSIPNPAVQREISDCYNGVMEEVLQNFADVVTITEAHGRRVSVLDKSKRLSGTYKPEKVIFKKTSPFEQFLAYQDYLQGKSIRKIHTQFLYTAGNDYIPVRISPPENKEANPMHIMLGATRGEKEAPPYKLLATGNDDAKKSEAIFAAPLFALEVVRQFDCSAATIIKENSYQAGVMDEEERYGSDLACVELKGQFQDATQKKKWKSAGLNICHLAKNNSDVTDPKALEVFINEPIVYEEMFPDCDDGYLDDFDISVSPGQMILASEKAISKGDYEEVTRICQNLAITVLGEGLKSKSLRNHFKEILKVNSSLND
ncbi:MAG: hypothetical protein EBZ47_02820, partial [Chlamydiae bacterium]|nr:hypothetical protein [Chlamydiota bacterium]